MAILAVLISFIIKNKFSKYVSKSVKEFVLFFSPSCGYCQEMMESYDALGKNYKKIKLGKVDCSRAPRLARKYKIN